jgi:hypothetical protein
MLTKTVYGVFASGTEALAAKAALVGSGIAPGDIALSTDLTRDDLAAEAPGQAYESHSEAGLRALLYALRGADPETVEARFLAAVQRGSVVLAIGPVPVTAVKRIAALLEQYKAVAVVTR